LRPEAIAHSRSNEAPPRDAITFRGTIHQQLYGGANETLEIACGKDQNLRARVAATGPLTGEQQFYFYPADAIRVSP
jgi:hypothetical protein